jgi:O-antigen/teichoic acid export membrane protein
VKPDNKQTPGSPNRQAVITSLRWTASSVVVARVLSLASVVVVARELGPAVFGMLAIVYLANEILGLLAEAGISSAVIQAPELTRQQRATVYSFEWMLGIVAVLAMFGLSPMIARAAGYPELAPLLAIAACSILVESSARHIAAMLQRAMQFNRIALAGMARDFTRSIGAIALVFFFGIWGVVIAHLAGSVIWAAIIMIFGVRDKLFPGFALSFGETRPLLAFGAYRAGTVVLNRIGKRVDQVVVAAALTPAMLGIYRLTTQLTSSTLNVITTITGRVSFSVFSRQQHDRGVALSSFLLLTAVLSTISAPVTAALVLLAEPVVALLFGPSWQGLDPLVGLLALFYFLRIFESSAIPLVNGVGKAKQLMRWSAVTSVFYISTVALASLAKSVLVIAATMVSVQAFAVLVFYFVILKPTFGPFGRRYLLSFVPAILCAILAAPALLLAYAPISLSPIFQLSVACAAYIALYGVLSYGLNREPLQKLLDAVLPMIKKRL